MQDTSRRIGEDTLDAAFTDGLEVSCDACNSTASTTGACESINVAASLVPDLGTRCLNMCATVGNVVELVGPHGVVEFLGVSLGLVVVVVRVLESDSRDRVDLGTEQSQKINLALGLCVGHVDDQLVALGAANVGETNASVSGGTLNNGSTRLEQATLFGIFDNVQSGAILDTASGVLELGLAQNVTSRLVGETLHADQRSVTNGCATEARGQPKQLLRTDVSCIEQDERRTVNEAIVCNALCFGDFNKVSRGGSGLD